jgi:hypothetical protein
VASIAPDSIRHLVEVWRGNGSSPQPPIDWPRQQCIDLFQRHRSRLTLLPNNLDRSGIRSACADASESPEAAEAAFIVALAWGFGTSVGYGPWRINRILATNRRAAARLQAVAKALGTGGASAAYGRLSNDADCRLRFLGPAFGTKFLAFCSVDDERPALILDELVSAWLRRNTELDVNPIRWDLDAYRLYLDKMYGWAKVFQVRPDDLEYLVFSAERRRRAESAQGTPVERPVAVQRTRTELPPTTPKENEQPELSSSTHRLETREARRASIAAG